MSFDNLYSIPSGSSAKRLEFSNKEQIEPGESGVESRWSSGWRIMLHTTLIMPTGLGILEKSAWKCCNQLTCESLKDKPFWVTLAGAEPPMCYETSAQAMPPKPHGDIIVPSAPPPIVQSCHTGLVFHV